MAGPEPTVVMIAEVIYGVVALSAVIGTVAILRALGRGGSQGLVNGRVIRSARRIEVEYVVQGVAYVVNGTTNYNDAPPPGAPIAVCYAPGNPENAKIVGENYGGAIAGLVVAFVFAVIATGLLLMAYQMGGG